MELPTGELSAVNIHSGGSHLSTMRSAPSSTAPSSAPGTAQLLPSLLSPRPGSLRVQKPQSARPNRGSPRAFVHQKQRPHSALERRPGPASLSMGTADHVHELIRERTRSPSPPQDLPPGLKGKGMIAILQSENNVLKAQVNERDKMIASLQANVQRVEGEAAWFARRFREAEVRTNAIERFDFLDVAMSAEAGPIPLPGTGLNGVVDERTGTMTPMWKAVQINVLKEERERRLQTLRDNAARITMNNRERDTCMHVAGDEMASVEKDYTHMLQTSRRYVSQRGADGCASMHSSGRLARTVIAHLSHRMLLRPAAPCTHLNTG